MAEPTDSDVANAKELFECRQANVTSRDMGFAFGQMLSTLPLTDNELVQNAKDFFSCREANYSDRDILFQIGVLLANLNISSTPSGDAGGDLSGTYPDPSVANIKGAVPAYALPQTLTDASTISFDVSLGVNAKLTIAGDRTLGAPSNIYAGASGNIAITQGSGGSHTLAYNAVWKFPGGSDPVLSVNAGNIDLLSWYCTDGTNVFAVINLAFA